MHPLKLVPMVIATALAFALLSAEARAQPWVELEAGPVFNNRNEVQVPGDTGTRFSLVDDLDAKPALYGRARLGWYIGRHRIAVLAAPVRVSAEGTIDQPVRFQGQTFAAGAELAADYQFDTYRLSYRYLLVDSAKLELGVGVTLLLRDAEIRLDDGTKSAKKTDLGVVPLLRLELRYRFHPWLALALDAEGLAAPQGRAFDVLSALEFPVWKHVTTYVGYRFIEGGVDNDEVYNFAFLSFVAVGIRGTL